MEGHLLKSNSSSVFIRGRCASRIRRAMSRCSRSSSSACSSASRKPKFEAFPHRLFGELGALGSDGRQMPHLTLLADGGYFQHRGACSWRHLLAQQSIVIRYCRQWSFKLLETTYL